MYSKTNPTTKQIIDNIDKLLKQAQAIAKERVYDYGIVRVYYAGGTLFLDLIGNKMVMININGEEFNVVDGSVGDAKETRRLLPINALKTAFNIYEMVKGKNDYYQECFNKSCIRHLIN